MANKRWDINTKKAVEPDIVDVLLISILIILSGDKKLRKAE
ncbi:MAG TPA: hypothetical protein VK203_12205 [Nostocaceae cyanobacterium]|nr:hypothetical protein [Nostocaceae cyanobacterium]